MLGLSLASAGRCQVHVPRRGPPPGRGRSALGHGWAIGLWVPPGCRPARCPELLVGAAKLKRAEGRWARGERAAPIRPQRGAPGAWSHPSAPGKKGRCWAWPPALRAAPGRGGGPCPWSISAAVPVVCGVVHIHETGASRPVRPQRSGY